MLDFRVIPIFKLQKENVLTLMTDEIILAWKSSPSIAEISIAINSILHHAKLNNLPAFANFCENNWLKTILQVIPWWRATKEV